MTLKSKIGKNVKSFGFWILVSLYIGFVLGWFLKPSNYTLKCPKCEGLLTPDEVCKLFYNCDFGFGTLGNLNCYCNKTWKVFGYKDLVKVVENG